MIHCAFLLSLRVGHIDAWHEHKPFGSWGTTGGTHPRARSGLSSLDANFDDSPVGARSSRGHHHRPPMNPRPFAGMPGVSSVQ